MTFAQQANKNLETGEVENQAEIDQETGEVRSYVQQPNLNGYSAPGKKFHIPKSYLNPDAQKSEKCALPESRDSFSLSEKEKVLSLKEEIILGYNKTSHRLFLIPSLFFFFRLTAMIIFLVELILHIWAHKKNNSNDNPNIYYRSPLHVISSQFCELCRSDRFMNRVSNIQDKRHLRYQIANGLARTMG